MKELNAIKDFVLSLEATKLNSEQQSVLLVGEDSYGANGNVTNSAKNCICNNAPCPGSQNDVCSNTRTPGTINNNCSNAGGCSGSSNGICETIVSSGDTGDNTNGADLSFGKGFSGFEF